VGWVEGDCIRCRYHGWKYDSSGQCVEQPGEDESFAAKTKIRSYPTQEHLGLIFAYFGEGEPPPIRRFPDFEDAADLAVGPPQLWPCNYFNRIDNACDPLHVGFTHRVALGRVERDDHIDARGAAATVSAEETEYGVKTTVTTPGSPPSYLHFHMPNTNQLGAEAPTAHSGSEARSPWGDRMFWRVPVDDTHCVSFLVGILRLPSDPTASQRRRQAAETVAVSPNDAADAVLAGKIRVEDAPSVFNQRELFWVEDYVTEVGQGPIADRTQERLGQRDVGVATLRAIWRRELKALAEGRPLKQWTTPSGLLSVPEDAVATTRG
jgi:5,5'-dehydrodivanillate O-demethylase